MSSSAILRPSSTFLESPAEGVDGSCVPSPSVDSQSVLFLGTDVFPTWTYIAELIQRGLQALMLHMCVRGDCNLILEALKPLNVFRRAHVPQRRALKLLTRDFEIYNGDSKAEKLWRIKSVKTWRSNS